MENVIEIQELTKDFGKGNGIFNINLEVKKGEIFGYLGPNGARKVNDDKANDGIH